jgi:hypothetical protein
VPSTLHAGTGTATPRTSPSQGNHGGAPTEALQIMVQEEEVEQEQ